MVIFSKNKRNAKKKMEKIVVCTKMMLEKMFAETYTFKKNHDLHKKISHTPLQKNDGPSLTLFSLKN